MANVGQLFAQPDAYDHPKLRAWRSQKRHGDTATSSIEFRRERDGLVYKPARLYFEVQKRDGTITTDMEPWDERLDLALMREGFRAHDLENESERFGFMLESFLEPLQIRFGDGFFNSAFVAYLRDNGYSDAPDIADKLEHVTENTVSPRSYADIAERLDGVFSDCARYLNGLGYEAGDGEKILFKAIAYYLDDRYSITNRSLLGW